MRALLAADARKIIEKILRFGEVLKMLFVGAKGFGVMVKASVDEPRAMFDVQHLVIKNIFDEPLRHVGGVQSFADNDSFVCGVVMT